MITVAASVGASADASKTEPVAKGTAVKVTKQAEKFQLIHVADLAPIVKEASKTVFIFDANNAETRQKNGVIPGAKLLASSSEYDVKTTLPADKNAKLVFYCANEQCMASHGAAKRAADAGFKNVNVLADGIIGWVKAGQTVAKAN